MSERAETKTAPADVLQSDALKSWTNLLCRFLVWDELWQNICWKVNCRTITYFMSTVRSVSGRNENVLALLGIQAAVVVATAGVTVMKTETEVAAGVPPETRIGIETRIGKGTGNGGRRGVARRAPAPHHPLRSVCSQRQLRRPPFHQWPPLPRW